jgi:small subunit ribosomal protein S16
MHYRGKEVISTLRIRLRRMGKKKNPFYRIVVTDSREAVDGKFKEILGHYDPFRKVPLRLELDRIESWVAKGARPTETVLRLMDIAKRGPEQEDLDMAAEAIETAAAEEETEIAEQKEEDS